MDPRSRIVTQRHSQLPAAGSIRMHSPWSVPTFAVSVASYTSLWNVSRSPVESPAAPVSTTVSVVACSITWILFLPCADDTETSETVMATPATRTAATSGIQRLRMILPPCVRDAAESDPVAALVQIGRRLPPISRRKFGQELVERGRHPVGGLEPRFERLDRLVAVAGDERDGLLVGPDHPALTESPQDGDGDPACGLGEHAFRLGEQADPLDHLVLGAGVDRSAGLVRDPDGEVAVGGVADGERARDRARLH